ncbi:Cellobiose dehydrogenase [Sphaceloma murrayae]|uniref:Cellobiose dehydrogenase n=1 Tax=Sphaceloma murrayae TaxID=2082308 RepID=A0A2K1R383_9PEZI|nr:Cellobiose dehydrogenase [Sphaceloma murrayae]
MTINTNGATNGTNGVNGHHKLPALAESSSEFLGLDYDYVIVGGGTAGLVVAARLTENPDIKVGVLEAGPSRLDDPLVDTPAYFLQMLGNPNYDYVFYTEPQKHNQSIRHQHPRGKMLGGSSAINYMMYVRGSDQDYDDWAELVGDKGWSQKVMKQYMRKHQTLEPIDPNVAKLDTMPFVGEHHGTDGPVRTSFNPTVLDIENDMIKAADEATGLSKKPLDPWSGDHIGFYNTLGSVVRSGLNKGKRSYAGRGYFAANASRPNLKVLCDATVAKVAMDGDKATGVEFSHDGSRHTVKAGREVIISCGTYQSPQVLELSGIGDPKVLEAAGVECKIELPGVGNNLNDHVLTSVVYELKPGIISLDAIHLPGVLESAQKELAEMQAGGLTQISSCQGFFPYKMFANDEELAATIKLVEAGGENEFQKRQLKQVAAHLKSDTSANLQMVMVSASGDFVGGIKDQSVLFPPLKNQDQPLGVSLAMCHQYPASRGYVHITSSDPAHLPKLDPRYLSNEADVNVLAAGLMMADKTAKSKHVADKLARRAFPREELDLSKLEDAKTAAREAIMTEYHPVGTCALGEVVDTKCRVKGTRNLRVIDASVFPNHVSGNIVSSVYAVAEKGADLVKEDW